MATNPGRNPGQRGSRVSRVPQPRQGGKNPGPRDFRNDLAEHRNARPGQQAPDQPTTVGKNTPIPYRGPSTPTGHQPSRGVNDEAGKGTRPSIFQRMGARNKALGARNRPTA